MSGRRNRKFLFPAVVVGVIMAAVGTAFAIGAGGTAAPDVTKVEPLTLGQAQREVAWQIKAPAVESVVPDARLAGIYLTSPPGRRDLTTVHMDWTVGEEVAIRLDQAAFELDIGGESRPFVVNGVAGKLREATYEDGSASLIAAWSKGGISYLLAVKHLDGTKPDREVFLRIASLID